MKRSARNNVSQTLLAFALLSIPCTTLILAESARANTAQTQTNVENKKVQSASPETASGQSNSAGLQSLAATKLPNPNLVQAARLWLTMKWGKIGSSTEVFPMPFDTTLPKPQAAALANQIGANVDVQNRVNDWRQWYENVFAAVPKGVDEKPPAQRILFKVSVTVTNDRKIHAFCDFANGNEPDCIGTVYAGKIVSAMKSLDDSAVLKFPASSTQTQTKFFFQTDGFEDVELVAIGNRID